MEKAIKHLKYTFSKERIFRKQEDLDALNTVIDFYNEAEGKALKNQKLFIKLFINEFLRHTVISGRTSSEAIKEVERLLSITTDEYYYKVKNEVPYLRFSALSDKIGIVPLLTTKEGVTKVNNSEEVKAANREIIGKHQEKLKKALTTEFSEEECKKFLDGYIYKTIKKFSIYD